MLNKVTCVFIDSDGRTYRKRVGIVNGLAPVTINGRSCVYDVGSSRFTPPTFKVGCSAPLDASYCYSTFNTMMMLFVNRKGRADFVTYFTGSLRCSCLLDCIDNGLHLDKFTLVSVSVLKGEGLYDFALEKGVIEGDFVVFTDDVVRELRHL